MNIKREGNKVYINAPDLGWHCAGCFQDVKANWPQYSLEVDAFEQEYLEEKEAAEKTEAERIKLQKIKDKEIAEKAEANRIENERKAKEALQKQIDEAVKAALAKVE